MLNFFTRLFKKTTPATSAHYATAKFFNTFEMQIPKGFKYSKSKGIIQYISPNKACSITVAKIQSSLKNAQTPEDEAIYVLFSLFDYSMSSTIQVSQGIQKTETPFLLEPQLHTDNDILLVLFPIASYKKNLNIHNGIIGAINGNYYRVTFAQLQDEESNDIHIDALKSLRLIGDASHDHLHSPLNTFKFTSNNVTYSFLYPDVLDNDLNETSSSIILRNTSNSFRISFQRFKISKDDFDPRQPIISYQKSQPGIRQLCPVKTAKINGAAFAYSDYLIFNESEPAINRKVVYYREEDDLYSQIDIMIDLRLYNYNIDILDVIMISFKIEE